MSIVRAVAPAWRSGCHNARTGFEFACCLQAPEQRIAVALFVGRCVLQPHLRKDFGRITASPLLVLAV
jgi:hypothetical protein